MTVSAYLLKRIHEDPRLAYYFDPLTRSMELLTATYADEQNLDVELYRESYYATLKFERPLCRECREAECQ